MTDPLLCADELRLALADLDLDAGDPGAAGRAALRLAVALGFCRLFGVEPGPDLDGTLPPALTLVAARELVGRLCDGCADARALPGTWDACEEAAEAEDLSLDLLQRRMDAWAALVAIDEGYLDALDERAPEAADLWRALDQVLDTLAEFDGALRAQADWLAVAAETELLNNWCALLAPPYDSARPWWLDGTLEAAGRRVAREAVAWNLPASVQRHLVIKLPVVRRRLVAAATPTAPPRPTRLLAWEDPNGRYTAELLLPDFFEQEDDPVIVTFHHPDRRLASEMADPPTTVELAGVTSRVEGSGVASFPLNQFAAAEAEPSLAVGGVIWPFRGESPVI